MDEREDQEASARARKRLAALAERPPTDEALARRAVQEPERGAASADVRGAEELVSDAERVEEFDPQQAARLLLLASVVARGAGAARAATELCMRAARLAPETPCLHRAWGLALLAWGDVDGARGHLERWCDEEPDSIEALVWAAEVSYGRRPVSETGPLIERLAAKLRHDPEDQGPRVLVVEAALSRATALSDILARWRVEQVSVARRDWSRGRIPRRRFDLLLAPLPLELASAIRELERVRSLPGFAATPLLGTMRLEAPPADVYRLRERGVLGLVDSRASAEQVAFRIAQAIHMPGHAARHNVRVPVDFLVELTAGDATTLERAENLSCGGIRIRSTRRIEINSEVCLRFRVGSPRCEELALEGRVVHSSETLDDSKSYKIGIFFPSLPPREREVLETEVDRLLAAPSVSAVLAA